MCVGVGVFLCVWGERYDGSGLSALFFLTRRVVLNLSCLLGVLCPGQHYGHIMVIL